MIRFPGDRERPRKLRRWDQAEAYAEKRRLEAQAVSDLAEHAARGERRHPVDPADPWSATVWRRCEPGCPQHPPVSHARAVEDAEADRLEDWHRGGAA